MKKKCSILILTFGLIVNAFSQKPTIELTFTAKNYLQHVPLDIILIENLTQGGDTTLYAPDTVFVIDYVSNIDNNQNVGDNIFYVSQNYPNPFNEQTDVSVCLPKKEYIIITVRDILGREQVRYEKTLKQGKHTFSFYPGCEKYYLFTVTGEQASKTIKMVNTMGNKVSGGKCRIVQREYKIDNNGFKSQQAINGFVFNPGDELKYTAYTYIGELSIIDSPTGNQTYEFQYTGIPCPATPTLTDIDENTYNTVQIGEQCWMKENLETTTYRNGTPIPNITDSIQWGTLTNGAYVWYDNDISWKDLYGALYNWYTVIDSNSLCPTGWHVPSQEEWMALTDFIGGWIPPYGDMLKSCRQVNSPLGGDCLTSEHPRWEAYGDYYGTDDFGFSGLPGGNRYFEDGLFTCLGEVGFHWTTTEFSSTGAHVTVLLHNYDLVAHSFRHKNEGFSVRCLKD